MAVQVLNKNKNGTYEYTLDSIDELDLLPTKGIDTGSICEVADGANGLRVFWFTKGAVIKNIEQDGVWTEI